MFQQVTLTAESPVILKPLVESAIQSELKAMSLGLHRTERNLRAFEARFGMSSHDFYRQFSTGAMAESLDLIEWAGEVKTCRILQDNLTALKGVRVC